MQLSNYTYTNLYPTINFLPLQDYDLLDESNIKKTLNDRFYSINFQENKINKSLLNIAISNPKYLNEFFSRYSGPIFYKKFQYPIASDYSYRDYFNNEAVHMDVNSNWIVFPCNEAGRCEETDYIILIFDYEGKLVAPYNYKIRNLQSGLTIYVRKKDLYTNIALANYNAQLLSDKYTLKVVVIKKKNVTEKVRYIKKTIYASDVITVDDLISSRLDIDDLSAEDIVTDDLIGRNGTYYANLDLSQDETNMINLSRIKPILDTNYYTVFKKENRGTSDIYHRQLHRVNYNTILTDNYKLSFNLLGNVLYDTEFLIMNTIDYSELNIIANVSGVDLLITDVGSKFFNYDLLVEQYTASGFVNRIPLVTKIDNEYYPLPYKRVYDIYLWINGIKLTPGVDFFIDYNQYNDSSPPSIVLCDDKLIPVTNNSHIRIILNQPYHPRNLCAYFDTIGDKGTVDFENDIVSYSAKMANLAFSNGKFVSSDQIEILNSGILAIKGLNTSRRFEYNFNYLVNSDISDMVDYFKDYETDLNKFIRYSGYSKNIINDYIDYNHLTNNLSNEFINTLACLCASTNFSRFVNIEIDRTGGVFRLVVTGLRLNNETAIFNGERKIHNTNIKYIKGDRENNDCLLVINCNR